MEITKVCCDCGIEKPLKGFQKCFSGRLTGNSVGYEQRNPQGTVKNRCKSCYAARERIRYFLDFYDAMGGRCECCGETDVRFLTLDHRNGDGYEQRQTLQCQQIYRLARKEGYPKDKYALLCWNCNCGRHHRVTDGVCPHRSAESSDEYVKRIRAKLVNVGQKSRKKETGPRPWKSKEMVGNKFAADLSADQVRSIREMQGQKSHREIGKEFGVSRQLVGMIVSGKRWANG